VQLGLSFTTLMLNANIQNVVMLNVMAAKFFSRFLSFQNLFFGPIGKSTS
jgi:hypothetical protein